MTEPWGDHEGPRDQEVRKDHDGSVFVGIFVGFIIAAPFWVAVAALVIRSAL